MGVVTRSRAYIYLHSPYKSTKCGFNTPYMDPMGKRSSWFEHVEIQVEMSVFLVAMPAVR